MDLNADPTNSLEGPIIRHWKLKLRGASYIVADAQEGEKWRSSGEKCTSTSVRERQLLDLKGGCKNRIRGESNPFRLYGGSLKLTAWFDVSALGSSSRAVRALQTIWRFPKVAFYPPHPAPVCSPFPPWPTFFTSFINWEALLWNFILFREAFMHLCCTPICTSFFHFS